MNGGAESAAEAPGFFKAGVGKLESSIKPEEDNYSARHKFF